MASTDFAGHPTYTTRENAARAAAAVLGHRGRVGGWIYTATGRVIAQGWSNYSRIMVMRGHVVRIGDRWRLSGSLIQQADLQTQQCVRAIGIARCPAVAAPGSDDCGQHR